MWNNEIINLDEALERVLWHKDIYIRWLSEFFISDILDNVFKAFRENNRDKAHRTAHKLKGTALNLALPRLAEQALFVDDLVKDGADLSGMQSELDKLTCFFEEASDMFFGNINYIERYKN